MKESSLLLVSGPADSDPHEQLQDLRQALGNGKLGHASLVEFPQFKVSLKRFLHHHHHHQQLSSQRRKRGKTHTLVSEE